MVDHLAMTLALLAAALLGLETRLLPNRIMLPAAVAALVLGTLLTRRARSSACSRHSWRVPSSPAVSAAAFGGAVHIADTSARARAGHPTIRDEWSAALRSGLIATCSITTLELLYAAHTPDEVRELEADEATLRDIPITVSVQRAAIAALRDLSRKGAGYHRVKLPEALIAAAAQQAGIGVLHYDDRYDRLAEVLNFDSRWIAAPGAL